jgi:hypothetical protein
MQWKRNYTLRATELLDILKHESTECGTTMLLWQIYVAGNNKTYVLLHV